MPKSPHLLVWLVPSLPIERPQASPPVAPRTPKHCFCRGQNVTHIQSRNAAIMYCIGVTFPRVWLYLSLDENTNAKLIQCARVASRNHAAVPCKNHEGPRSTAGLYWLCSGGHIRRVLGRQTLLGGILHAWQALGYQT
jgi:hypothetical protein